VLGGSALGLAAVGLYGVLAFGVGQRRREFAVRKALGSTDREVFRGVLRHGLAIVVAGTALGAGLAISSVYVMRDPRMPALQMQASDLWPFILTEVILCLVAFLACLGPARRAMKADPAEILRAV
jgi:ABC-type lipoprotein release transport system permease subunit